LIDRGGRLEVVGKNFGSLFKVPDADAFAKKLVDAAGGTLKLADAMALANKAVSAGVGIKDIPTIFEFASREAAAFGEESTGAITSIVGAINSGNFRFLKSLGIDIGDVADQFEELTAGGKLSGLDFAARKAEVISAAIAKMKEEATRFNFTGRESLFLWSRLKNEISDSVDKLALAVVKNEKFKNGLTEFRNLFSGFAQHIEQGGSVMDVLFGKVGGKSGGLLGLLKAGLIDAGEALGRGILGGILLGISKIPELFGMAANAIKAGGGLVEKIGEAIQVRPHAPMPGFGITYRDDPALDPPKSWGIKPQRSAFDRDQLEHPQDIDLPARATSQPATSQPATSQPSVSQRLFVPGFDAAVGEPFGPSMDTYDAYIAWKKARMRELDTRSPGGGGILNRIHQNIDNGLETSGLKWLFGKMKEAVENIPDVPRQFKQMVTPGALSYGGMPLFPGLPLMPFAMAQTATSQPAGSGSAWYTAAGMKEGFLEFAELSGQAGQSLLSGGVLGGQSRLAEEYANIKEDFPYNSGATLPNWIDPAEFRFTAGERARRKSEIARDKHNLARINRGESIEGGPSLRSQSRMRAQSYIKSLRASGRYVSPRAEKAIYDRGLRNTIEGAARPVEDRIYGAEQDIVKSDSRRDLNRQASLYAGNGRSSSAAAPDLSQYFEKLAGTGKEGFEGVKSRLDALIKAVQSFMSALAGEEGKMAAVGSGGK
jgi:hypothetical protein